MSTAHSSHNTARATHVAEVAGLRLQGNLPTFPSTPASRDYFHSSCGNTTTVDDWAFEAICDPFYATSGTICAACNKGYPLDEFAWADTGENIESYRKRLKAFVPPEYAKAQSLKKLRLALFTLLPLAGFAVANLFANRSSPTPFLLSAGVGLVLAIVLWFVFPKTPKLDFRRYV